MSCVEEEKKKDKKTAENGNCLCQAVPHRLFWGSVPQFIHLLKWNFYFGMFSTWQISRIICSIMWAEDSRSVGRRWRVFNTHEIISTEVMIGDSASVTLNLGQMPRLIVMVCFILIQVERAGESSEWWQFPEVFHYVSLCDSIFHSISNRFICPS